MTTAIPQLETAAQLDALLHHAALAHLDDTGWLRVTGDDRVRWLNGMVTNSITDLKPGQGCFNFILSAQGRIQGTATAFALEDSILLETSTAGGLATLLDHFIIMDDVELDVLRNARSEIENAASNGQIISSVPHDREGLLLAGPTASTVLAGLKLEPGPELSLVETTWRGHAIELITAHSPLVPRLELWADAATIATLTTALTEAGALPATPEALEHLRILEGTPRYGTDIRNSETAKDLPQETAQTRALHFAKGCYLGQEIVERIRSRGNVHRSFAGFRLTGALPPPGTLLVSDGKPVGEVTSAAAIPIATEKLQVALGYIRREALERGLPLTFSGGEATPAPLPFAIP